jgi:hydroxypyruvate isomerase
MNRREFGQLAAAATLAQALPRIQAQTSPPSAAPRFSVMIWTLEKLAPFDRCLEIVSAAGYQGVELTGQYQQWSPADKKHFLSKAHSLGLVFDLLGGAKAGFADPNGSTEFFAGLAMQLSAAKELEIPQINLKSGNRIDAVARKAQYTAAVENLNRAGDLAAAQQIQIVIEPIDPLENPSMYLNTVSEAFEMVREVAHPNVKVLYDFYHEQRAYGNLIEKLEQNIDYVGLVHIADVPGRHQPGTGEINYLNIYRKLAELKYNKFITMEFYPTGDPVAQLKAARIEAQQAMSRS